MTIDQQKEALILRYHFVEHWGVHTIARQLHVHHSTVERVLSQAGLPRVERTRQRSMIDPYLPFIIGVLEEFPTLPAARLYHMCVERGYPGAPSQFRARISQLRPRPKPEAYLRLKTLPGEQAQVDWGHFDKITVGRAERPLMAFVMVLSYSRKIFLRFYMNQRMGCFLHGHVAAFNAWGGLPRVLLYDNLKSAVLDRHGDTIRFHPTLVELATHYRFEPRPVAVARGNEKGRVERAIRYVRDSFFAARHWTDLDDLNDQAQRWCDGVAANRRCPEDEAISVREAFDSEQPRLLALPNHPFCTDERVDARVGKTPYVRFDLNDYSIPHQHVRSTVSVQASLDRVRILAAGKPIAEHPRSYDKRQHVECTEHIQALIDSKRGARHHRLQHRLTQAAPSCEAFLTAALQEGNALQGTVSKLEKLLDTYGARELEAALAVVLESTAAAHPHSVSVCLEQRREKQNRPVPLTLSLATHDRSKKIVIRPASLARYDQLRDSDSDSDSDSNSNSNSNSDSDSDSNAKKENTP